MPLERTSHQKLSIKMERVKISIRDKDRMVGAMVMALAVEVVGFQSVSGATKEFLEEQGYYVFAFPTDLYAFHFKKAVRKYFPAGEASVI